MSQSDHAVRYAVVGLGSFAQLAILPAFTHAKKNSILAALVSDDAEKKKVLGKTYKVSRHYSYEEYDECLRSGAIDAVYIALPNTLHKEFAVRAAEAGIHVLCEKPLATSEADCLAMISAAEKNKVKLMTAYRLHFEQANLAIVDLVQKGEIGDPKYFSSSFSHQVRSGDVRTKDRVGGGGLWDLGVYCVNAARALFRAEPFEVFAMTANTDPQRFHGVDEIATAILRFPRDRFAQFTTSQGASDCSQFRIVGSEGSIDADPAYEYAEGDAFTVNVKGKKKTTKTLKRDQVAAELLYFSDCILKDKEPEPSGREGLLDVRVIQALYGSAKSGQAVILGPAHKKHRPTGSQTISPPAHSEKSLVHAQPPSL
jgi:predicted dehydrogenase